VTDDIKTHSDGPATSQHGHLPEIEKVVRRVVGARIRDPDTVDDLVQETLTRLVETQARLEDGALLPYAVVTARNLVSSLGRTEERRRRHAARLIDLRTPDQPEEEMLRQEEGRAVKAALDRLGTQDRRAVVAFELEDVDTATLAEQMEWTRGGAAVRLSRARAKLRVEYLLAMRREEPPTDRCRPVLAALSAGDRRRQAMLDAGRHLIECRFCASLGDPLVERRRDLAGLLPIPLLRLWEWLRTPKGATSVGATGAAVAAIVVALNQGGEPPKPRPSPPAETVLTTAGGKPIPLENLSAGLGPFAGRALVAEAAPVHSVPTDEGFWIGHTERDRVWVRLTGTRESPYEIEAGAFVTFDGKVARHPPGYARALGMTDREGADLLRENLFHIDVEEGRLRVSKSPTP
jgi:RNA polymerase sigma factor (sigma-70 family)